MLYWCLYRPHGACEQLCTALYSTSRFDGGPQSLAPLFLGSWAEKFGNLRSNSTLSGLETKYFHSITAENQLSSRPCCFSFVQVELGRKQEVVVYDQSSKEAGHVVLEHFYVVMCEAHVNSHVKFTGIYMKHVNLVWNQYDPHVITCGNMFFPCAACDTTSF